MTHAQAPTPRLDRDYSDPEAEPLPWLAVVDVLTAAPISWLTTVRSDGRPHVTPLLTVWSGIAHFCTGPDEQKARNLRARSEVALTTGTNALRGGVDVVVEGRARRVTQRDRLQELADAWEQKYGPDWHFDVAGDAFAHRHGGRADVYRIETDKVIAFAKDPYSQTSFRWPAAAERSR